MFVHYKTFLLQMLSQLPQCITQVPIYGNGKFLASCTEIMHVIKIRSNFMIQNGGLENFLISNLSRPLGVFFSYLNVFRSHFVTTLLPETACLVVFT